MSDITLSATVVVRGKRRVVDGIGFDVPRGTWFGVIGANGSGKTSLLRALAGRLPLAAGICRVDGRDLAADRAARARSFGFCPPADRLPDLMRGRELLDYARCGAVTDHRRLAALWSALGIAELSDRWIGDCSAGMRQRLAIACAFVGGHTRIILDEPFNWLDPVAAYDLRQVLRAMVNDGLTLVTALHDLPVLASACDAGVILADGTVAATLDRKRLREAAVDPQAFERAMIDRLRSGR